MGIRSVMGTPSSRSMGMRMAVRAMMGTEKGIMENTTTQSPDPDTRNTEQKIGYPTRRRGRRDLIDPSTPNIGSI